MRILFHVNILLFGLIATACSNTSSTQNKQTASSAASTAAPTAAETFKSKLPDNAPVVKVVTEGTNVPFSTQDIYGNMSGYDIDVIREIGEHQGFKVQFFKESWDKLFTSVEQGKADLAISGISYSPEREAKYALSKPYFYNPSAMMYKNQSLNLKTLDDLKTLKVGVMTGTSQYDALSASKQYGELITSKTPYLLFQSLVQNKADVILIDYPILKSTANIHPEQKVTIVPYQDKNDPKTQQVILMAKNNQALLKKINNGIDQIKADGSLKKINDKWQIAVSDEVPTTLMSASSTAQ